MARPYSLRPQQAREPSRFTPQVWKSPALTEAKAGATRASLSVSVDVCSGGGMEASALRFTSIVTDSTTAAEPKSTYETGALCQTATLTSHGPDTLCSNRMGNSTCSPAPMMTARRG